MSRRLVVDLTVPRDPKCVFEGGYITKVELEAMIRGIRNAHKKVIFEYRKRKIISEYEANKLKKEEELKDGTDRESKTSESAESARLAESRSKSVSIDGCIVEAISTPD